ncbi:MAG TPA: hypothetical protein VFF79_03680 [Conexibacter sp.]|jgi:hypothetical protein|nr:hypothetical protein [Conexibacter sp.]
MFLLTTLAYPCVLAMLCIGAGLLVDRASGSFLPASLLPVVGAAALIAVSQLTTFVPPVAPATPYALAVVAALGLALGRQRVRTLVRARRRGAWQLVTPVLAYLVALAPLLAAGRLTFSSYQLLTDSALHIMGADFLVRHGQDYAHVDLHNSYGAYLHGYYGSSYPSGADTLFGGSAPLLRLSLLWAFQPFNAFMLATGAGAVWVLARRMGLDGAWAALAALVVTLPALVYGYALISSVKEIVALPMILALGALIALHPRWLRGPPQGAIPFALVVAAGLSALGAAFGAWALAAVVVLAAVAARDVATDPRRARALLLLVAGGGLAVLIAALPTWVDLSRALQVAQAIGTTSNPGNLSGPLPPDQAFGTWISNSYRAAPNGAARVVSDALAALTLAAGILGAVRLLRLRAYALAGWIASTLAVGIGLIAYATTWGEAKTLMLTSPIVMLIAWGGIAALRRSRLPVVAPLLALTLTLGVAASDAMQYHSSGLAPTMRYRELASLDARFAGRGPTLFTDFDEYALYVLRDLDVGGPDFIFPPPALRHVAPSHGQVVDLDRVAPRALVAYPLIVTRRNPSASGPPSAYRLLWEGAYYQVWGRRPGAPAALAHLGLSDTRPVRCTAVRRLARLASHDGGQLVAAGQQQLVRVAVAHASHPAWVYRPPLGLAMARRGALRAPFSVPHAGAWDLWLRGEIMPTFQVSVDGRPLAEVGAELSGSAYNTDTVPPFRLRLAAGRHRLTIARGGTTLAPGDGGAALIHAILLTPARTAGRDTLQAVPTDRWRTLCGRRLDWIEVVRGQRPVARLASLTTGVVTHGRLH